MSGKERRGEQNTHLKQEDEERKGGRGEREKG
jgi:hypothetical protein